MKDVLKSILTTLIIITIGILIAPWVLGIFGWTVEFFGSIFPFVFEYFNWVIELFIGG